MTPGQNEIRATLVGGKCAQHIAILMLIRQGLSSVALL